MNDKNYQLIWNINLGTWVVASELAKRGKKRSSARRKALILPVLALCSPASFALPTGSQVVSGQASVSTPSAGHLQINQSSQNAILNWQGFSIGSGESVNIHQPNAQAVQLDRVVGQDPSLIQGQLNSNGQVFLVNPNGVLFSKTAQVDVGGLVASSNAISNSDFLNGKLHFTQGGVNGSVVNQGQISVPNGGLVALIGEQVKNDGTINTPQGATILAAGNTVDLDMSNGVVEVKVTEAALNAQISNNGVIVADGGQVIMTAQSASQLLKTVINNEGIVEARGLVEKNGVIVLSGGNNGLVEVGGLLDASGQAANNITSQTGGGILQGGSITVSGAQIQVNSNAVLNAAGDAGGGVIAVGDKQNTQQTSIQAGATLNAQTLDHGNAGSIAVLASLESGAVSVAGQLDASAPKQGNGGSIETSASSVKIADSAQISSKAASGASGNWLIDPTDFTIAASGGDETGAQLSSSLNSGNVTILSSSGAANGNGNVNVNDVVSWSANTRLTLTASSNVNVNANITATGATAGIVVNPDTTNGGQAASGAGGLNVSTGASINLPNVSASSTTAFVVGAASFTVINSLGAPGSTTALDLQGINGNLAGYYALGSNLDASSTSTWNSGAGFTPIGNSATPFSGNFAGLGHTISGLTINLPSTNDVGLFGDTVSSATIHHIGLINCSVTGATDVGVLVGYNSGTIIHDYATGNVTGNGNVGDIAGVSYGTINNSYATGNAAGTAGISSAEIGGVVGLNYGAMSNDYASGNINGNNGVGGLTGYNLGTINDSYATGAVTGVSVVGGLVGYMPSGSVSNSYAMGAVSGGAQSGGLIGFNSGSVSNSFWDVSTSGTTTGIGSNSGSGVVGVYGLGYAVVNGALSPDGVTTLTTNSPYSSSSYGSFTFTTMPGATGNNWVIVDTDGSLNGTNGATLPMLSIEYSTTINNAHQLQLMEMNLSASYILGSNINASATGNGRDVWGGSGFVPVGTASNAFSGSLNGAGLTISNLTINQTTGSFTGLFGNFSGSMTNIALLSSNITGASDVGGLAGQSTGAISNSYVSSTTITGPCSAGLVCNNWGPITNSYVVGGSINGTSYSGGLVGWQGNNQFSISNSYSTASVSSLTGTYGGLIGGLANGALVTNSYWNTTTSGQNYGIGGVGAPQTGVTGLTSSQMMQLASFSSWNTATSNTIAKTGGSGAVWRIYEGNTMPLLTSFLTSLTLSDAPDATLTYNGATQSGANTAINGVLGATASGRNVGFYNGYYSTQQGYDIIGGNLTITPLALTGTIATGSSVYGSALTPGAVAFINAVAGDNLGATIAVNTTGNLSSSGNLKAGSYAGIESVTALTGANAGNYSFAGITGNYTVSQLALTSSIAAASSVYGST